MKNNHSKNEKTNFDYEQFLPKGGEMGRRIREYDWSQTALGAINEWKQSLLTAVNILLNSQHPMWIGWGPDLIFLYNDAYIKVLGLAKHPVALGRPAIEVWKEIWHICGPLAQKVIEEGESTFVDNVGLFMNRGDYLEEVYYSFSYSPIYDETKVIGLFCPSAPVTEKLLSERRLTTLGELSTKAFVEKTSLGASISAMNILAKNPSDIPFALLYLINPETQIFSLVESIGIQKNTYFISPSLINLAVQPQQPLFWPIKEIIENEVNEQIISVDNLKELPLGLENQRISKAIILPLVLTGQKMRMGILIMGINPCRKLDAPYHTFFHMVGNHIAMAMQNAKTYEHEKKRAEMLEELDRAKTTFFSNISHELRTPLHLMLSPIEEILGETDGTLSALNRANLEMVQRNGLRLSKLINGLLDFSKIEANRIQPVYELTPLSQLTADLASMFRSTIERGQLAFHVDTSDLTEEVYVDREMWEKIVFNLLSNAFKFTLQGSVTVSLKQQAGQVILTVQDTGVGIPAAELPRLFERFYRIENTAGRSYEGTGIGLSLVQELVKLQGGTTQVQSAVNQGTIFKVTIPLGNAHLDLQNIRTRESYRPGQVGNTYIEEAAGWLGEEATSSPKLFTQKNTDDAYNAARFGLTQTPKKHILVADDNSDMRTYLVRLLSPYGEIRAVNNGVAALEAINQQLPDLVLSDVMMPKLDGFGLLKALREDHRTQILPVLLLSARAGEEAKVEGMKSGADDYLVKPFFAKELVARVEAHLTIAELRKNAFHREQELLSVARQAQENLQQAMEHIQESFLVLNQEWRCTYINQAGLKFTKITEEKLLATTFWEIFPDIIGTPLEIALQQVMEKKEAATLEFFYPPHQTWYENRIYPNQEGISIFSTDITLRKQLAQEREQALAVAHEQQQQRLEQAENYRHKQTEFIDTLCHELRNPLGAVISAAGLLIEKFDLLRQSLQQEENLLSSLNGKELLNSLEQIREYMEVIEKCNEHQRIIVNDVLDLSKIENNKIELNTTIFNLQNFIQQLLPTFKGKIDKKGITLDLEANNIDIWIKADSTRLMQILTNLIDNAIKFTAAGKVLLQISHEAISSNTLKLKFSIQDTGIGMTPEEMNRLFDRFAQANRRTMIQYGGSGLGLSITKNLIEKMEGKINVSSQPQQGSNFEFFICCDILTPEEQLEIKKEVSMPQVYSHISQGNEKKKILVVEDNPINRNILLKVLATGPFECDAAQDGLEALEKYQNGQFAVILMDIEMPRMNGLAATKEIRQQETFQNKHTPIVGLSGNTNTEQIDAALQAGMDDYISKPCKNQELFAILDKVLNKTKGQSSVSQVTAPSPSGQKLISSDSTLRQFEKFQREESKNRFPSNQITENIIRLNPQEVIRNRCCF